MERLARPLLLLTDSLSTRVFFSSGIVQRLWLHTKGEIKIVALFDIHSVFSYRQWLDESCRDLEVIRDIDYIERKIQNSKEMVFSFIDSIIDRYFGFFPLAVRFCLLHGYHLERFKNGHKNPFLNLSLAKPFPKSKIIFELSKNWFFSRRRYTSSNLKNKLSSEVSFIITSNLQMISMQKYLNAAYQCNISVIGHIGSWDHPVGKGVVFPYCKKYIVHNNYMREKLVTQHNIEVDTIAVSGWPQMDPFFQKRSRDVFINLLKEYGLNQDKPCVLIAGNSEGNSPYEPEFIERFVNWWEKSGKCFQYSIIFRPHPRDIINENWKKRFGFLQNRRNVYIQSANYADVDILSLLLQHVNCVVTNAGTILLDSLVNDRPVVCVLYDEGAPKDIKYAKRNVAGDHYKRLLKSKSFVLAYDFDTVITGIEDAIIFPGRLYLNRKRIVQEIVGNIDGKSGERISKEILLALI